MNCIYCQKTCRIDYVKLQIYSNVYSCNECSVGYFCKDNNGIEQVVCVAVPYFQDMVVGRPIGFINNLFISPDTMSMLAIDANYDKSVRLDLRWIFPNNILDVLKDINKWNVFI